MSEARSKSGRGKQEAPLPTPRPDRRAHLELLDRATKIRDALRELERVASFNAKMTGKRGGGIMHFLTTSSRPTDVPLEPAAVLLDDIFQQMRRSVSDATTIMAVAVSLKNKILHYLAQGAEAARTITLGRVESLLLRGVIQELDARVVALAELDRLMR